MEISAILNEPLGRRLRMALVGGGGNGFIGKVHIVAATLDGRAELVAGAFSSQPEKSRAAGASFGVARNRVYGSYEEMISAEASLPAELRVDFITIATPNMTHYPIARLALMHGFNVVCEKPLTTNLEQALELAALVAQSGAVFVVAHNYSGYPLVRQAREMVAAGALGEIQAIRVHYLQGGLRGLVPGQRPLRGAWKSDPQQAGPSGTIADIGTHAYQLARYVADLVPSEISAHLFTFHPARPLEDYGHVIVRFRDGAVGAITVSQVTHGRLNDLVIEVDGSQGSLIWRQEDPNQLVLRRFGQPVQIYERHPAADYATAALRSSSRLPAGHPEAFFEAFANLYRDSYEHMIARAQGEPISQRDASYPTINDGIAGVQFVQQVLASHAARGAWQPLVD